MVKAILTRRYVLILAGVYFFICSWSAIFWPSTWYVLASIPRPESNAPLAVVGAMMGALSIGAFLAAFSKKEERNLIIVLIAANLLDLFVVLHLVSISELPLLNSILFVMIDLFWSVALIWVLLFTNDTLKTIQDSGT